MPEERTYFPFLEKATEQTGALSWAWRKVATHLLETPSQILMLPSVEPLTKCLPVLFHLRRYSDLALVIVDYDVATSAL